MKSPIAMALSLLLALGAVLASDVEARPGKKVKTVKAAQTTRANVRTKKVHAGTDGRYYVRGAEQFRGAWAQVRINNKTGKDGKKVPTITTIHIPSRITSFRKAPVPSASKRLFRKLSGKSPALDGKHLPVQLNRDY